MGHRTKKTKSLLFFLGIGSEIAQRVDDVEQHNLMRDIGGGPLSILCGRHNVQPQFLERWSWPRGPPRYGRRIPDACEIGYTWLTRSAIRSAANTEAKLLMLTHAFETWQVLHVCFHTDARNQRSRAALERIGGKYEGILRAHCMAADLHPRDSVRYSIVTVEWQYVKERLLQFIDRTRTQRFI